MSVKSFLDTNIILYAIRQDTHKKKATRQLVTICTMIILQVINECVNVCLKKFKFDKVQAYTFSGVVMNKANVVPVDGSGIRKLPNSPSMTNYLIEID